MNVLLNEHKHSRPYIVVGWPRVPKSRLLPALVVWTCLSWTGLVQAETIQTVEEFIAQKSKWASLEGATLQVEGRYSIFSTSQLRMEKCELEFVLARAFPNPASSRSTSPPWRASMTAPSRSSRMRLASCVPVRPSSW